MTRPWAIRVALLPDELFSTWLVRAALAQGCDPMHLTGSLWPGWRAWTVDLDRGLSADRLEVLAARSGLEAARLESATLRPLLAAVAPDVKHEQANWPWMLSLGSRNRRRQGGLQFCPLCLAEDATPYFRRTWRLTWHVGCTRHETLLTDHCGRCCAPVEPHRLSAADATLCHCPSCGHDLRRTATRAACVDALAFQRVADQVLASGHGTWAASVLPREAWFRFAGRFAGGRLLCRREDVVMPGVTSLAMNLQRPSERAIRLRMAFRGLNGECRGKPVLATRGGAMAADRAFERNTARHPAPPRPQAKVQGEWIRLLRRMRLGHP